MRSSTNAYSKTLLASIIANDGSKKAKEWAKGVLENLATSQKGGDRDQAKQMVAGVAPFAVMNTYYIGLLKTSKNPEDVKVGNALGIIFPNQDGRGTHEKLKDSSPKNAKFQSNEPRDSDAFFEWLRRKNGIFAYSGLVLGGKFEAKVLEKLFLGDFYKLKLDYRGVQFYALFPSNLDFNDTIKFDFKH